jgi:ABC-type transport system substrate-binding protein
MNMVAGLTKDVRVRKALASAFDYDGYVKAENGVVGRATGPIPPAMMRGWVPDNLPKSDLNRAKALLTEASVPAGTSFHVFVAKGDDDQVTAAQVLQASLSKIGYDVKIDIREFSDWSQAVVNWIEKEGSNPAKAPSDIFNLVVPPRIPNAWAYLWFNYHSGATRGAGRNWYQYTIPAIDRLIDEGSAQVDEGKRLELFKQAARRIVEDQPDIFFGNEQRISVRRKSVNGFEFHPAWFPEIHFYALRRGR